MASNSGGKMLRRYGPIVVVVLIVLGIVVVAGGGGDDDDQVTTGTGQDDGTATGDDDGAGNDLPLTFQAAQAAGTEGDIDWGDGCDLETGRLKVPVHNRPPCVEPWAGTDNGGATAPGVTADEIVIALYQGQPDALQQLLIEDAGADTDPADVSQTAKDYLEMFSNIMETYGRTLRVEVIEATGLGDDATAAAADAQRVIDLKPFAALGGPAQTSAYWEALTDAGIICVGTCSLAATQEQVEGAAPYLWPTGPNPNQADQLFAEFVGKQLVGKNAQYAGDPALQGQERVFGWVQAERVADEYKDRNDAFEQALADEYGGEIATRSTYIYDPARGQEIASTVIARLKDAGVTTVLLSTDPLVPKNITEEATKQNYFPEWVIGPSVLADTTIFGRTFDQQQWANAFGIGLPPAPLDNEDDESWFAHTWYFGEDPPVNSQAVIYPGPYRLLLGIHLAGPNLTPETFRDGLFGYEPEPPGKTYTRDSFGTDVWGAPDYNSQDDATIIWWDPDEPGEDEAGNPGVGMRRFVDGGTRYLPGEFPTEPVPLFDDAGTVTIYEDPPEADALPDYPPWPGSPAAGG